MKAVLCRANVSQWVSGRHAQSSQQGTGPHNLRTAWQSPWGPSRQQKTKGFEAWPFLTSYNSAGKWTFTKDHSWGYFVLPKRAAIRYMKPEKFDISQQKSCPSCLRMKAHRRLFFASASPRCLLDNSLIKPLEDLFFASASRLPQDRQIWLWREEVVESIVWVNQKEVCLKEDLCPLWSPHFLSSPCVNIFVADDCPNVINKLLIVELSDENKQVHH